jgi:predicted transposase/invertase (TIGR01784 family)
VYFIKNAGSLSMIPKSAESIPELNNAYTQAALFSWTKDELDLYEYWRMEETSDRYKMQEAHDKGIEIGKKRSETESARKMKQKGYSVEDIIEITGLSRDEIESLENL